MIRISLAARITVLVGAATVLIVGAAAFTMDNLVDAEMSQRMDDGLLTQARALESLIEASPSGLDINGAHLPHPHLFTNKVSDVWAVQCNDGTRLSSRPPPTVYPDNWMREARGKPSYTDVTADHQRLFRAVWFRFAVNNDHASSDNALENATCNIVFMRPRNELDDILTTIDYILLLTPLLALISVLVLSPALVKRGLKPLATLGDAMHDIGPQAPDQRLQTTGTHELEPLIARFNGVLDRMDEGITRERQFAGAVAHETRTHIAELRSLVEVEQRYPGGQPMDQLLDEISAVTTELQDTVTGLLLLTRLEAGIESTAHRAVPVSEVIAHHLASVAALMEQRALTVEQHSTERNIVLLTDHTLLDIIIGNLLKNAAAYAPQGSTIRIHLNAHSISVENDAPDVSAEEVNHFGQRFWSKHHGTDGHAGLGLALSGAAAAAIQFKLEFTLDAQQHLHATLSWPGHIATI